MSASSVDIRLKSLLTTLAEPALLFAHDGRIDSGNPAFCQLLGYGTTELTELSVEHLGLAAAAVRQKPPTMKTQVLRHRDGTPRHLELNFDYPSDATETLIFMTARPLEAQPAAVDIDHWRLAVDLGGDGMWEWDLRSGEKKHSEAWCLMLGYDSASVAADPDFWSRHLHPDDRSAAQTALNNCLSGVTPRYEAEYRLRCRNGSWKWIAARAVLERDNGTPGRLLGTHRDIDALRRMEAAYNESRHSFSQWLELSPDAIAITSCHADPVYVEVNAAYCQMLGCAREELIGRPTSMDQVWSSEIQAAAACQLLVDGTPIIDLPCRFKSRDGRLLHTSLSAQRILLDNQHHLLIARRDVGERVHAEQRQRESEERWRFAIEGHGDALWDWNVEARTIYRSPRWLELLGLPAQAATVDIRDHGHVFVLEDLPALSFGFRDLLAGVSDELSGECRLRCSDGSVLWTTYRCRVMERDDKGRASRVIGTTRDISQQRQRQKELERQLDRISHSGRLLALGEMATAIAHEVNQPLAVITSYAGVLLRKTGEQEDLHRVASIIEEQGLRAGQIIWRMRQFARHQDLALQPVNVHDLVHECLQWMTLDRSSSDVEFSTRLAPGMPCMAADHIQIEQVLLNLLRNAVQSMGDGHKRPVVVRGHEDRGRGEIIIEVADRGCGLPSQVAMDVFKPFFTTRAEGLGLGLSISQSIIARHQGRLWSTARAGGGTVFSFALPIALATEKRTS